MIEAVISDFGGVLTTPLAEAFARIQEDAGIPLNALGAAIADVTEREGANPLFELETGHLSEHAFMGALERALIRQLGRPLALERFGERYFAHLRPNAPMIERMRRLRGEGYRMALLTNNVREWEPRWRAMLPVDELFETVVDSAFVGVRKPDEAIYRLTLERLGLPASSCLFVDDVEINCDAAAELGMTTVQFVDNEQALAAIDAALTG